MDDLKKTDVEASTPKIDNIGKVLEEYGFRIDAPETADKLALKINPQQEKIESTKPEETELPKEEKSL